MRCHPDRKAQTARYVAVRSNFFSNVVVCIYPSSVILSLNFKLLSGTRVEVRFGEPRHPLSLHSHTLVLHEGQVAVRVAFAGLTALTWFTCLGEH